MKSLRSPAADAGHMDGDEARAAPSLAAYLGTGCALFGLNLGLVARVDGDELVVRASTDPAFGQDRVIPLAGTPAAAVVGEGRTVAAPCTSGVLGGLPLGAWLGTLVRSDGAAYVLAFAAAEPRPAPFSPVEVAAIEFMADALTLFLRAAEAEEAQRRSEATNRAILAALPDLLFRYDRRGVHLGGWAGRPEDLFVPLEDAMGRRITEVLPADLADRYLAAITRALDDGELQTLRYAGEAGGELRHFEARVVRCGPDQVLAIVRNVTDAVRAGEALAAEAALAAVIAEVATDLQSALPEDVDAAIVDGLRRIGTRLGARSACLCEDPGAGDADGDAMRVVHAWGEHGRPDDGQWATLAAELAREPSVLVAAGDGGPDRPPPGLWTRVGLGDAGPGPVVGVTWEGDPPPLAGAAVPLLRVFGEAVVGALARVRAEAVAEGQAAVLEVIARGAPLASTLGAVARLVQGHGTDLRSAVLVVGEDGRSMRVLAAPTLPATFDADLHLLPLGVSVTPWTMAVETAQPVVVADLAGDERFSACGPMATHVGIASAWVVPIVSARTGLVLGTIVTFTARRRGPTGSEWQLHESSAALAAIAIERAREEAALAFQATHDPLTKLANRTVLLDRLDVALARAQRSGRPLTLMFCDLDRFKSINDRFGHERGDALLVAVAERLSAVVRPTDTVARVGGDEFVVLCEDTPTVEDALRLAERVASAVEAAPFPLATTDVAVTVSLGIALSTGDHDHPEALLRDADEAMYRAKARGRARRELFEERIRRDARARAQLAEELAGAVDGGQLVVHYQPVISLRDGRARGAEALVRWRHPERGLLLPGEFIPLAEATGLIVPMGSWLFGVALDQLVTWSRDDPELAGRLTVHVNVSARQLVDSGLVRMVAEGLERTGLHPSALCLEITESVLMDESPATTGAIEALCGLGVQLALDDFGTGYASLTYLRSFPVGALKVDRSFVSGLGRGGEDDAIVAAVVDLAHALGLEAVAEGVETEEQLRCLRDLGCDAAQGFRFARPGPADDLTASLSRRFL
ncbi:MAG TPA: EAL domain-containing protein [Acidimicrobiales bacterium]|jgi:diguanylate cyclase (GGDEF)-like protein